MQSQTRSPGVWVHVAVFSDSERCYCGCQRARQSRLRYLPEIVLCVKSRPGLENIRPRLGLRSQDNPNICADRVIRTLHTHLREALRFVQKERRPGSYDITVMTHGILRVEEWALRHMRMSICSRWSHEGTPRSERLTSVIQLLPPVLFQRNGKLSTKPLVGSGVIYIFVP